MYTQGNIKDTKGLNRQYNSQKKRKRKDKNNGQQDKTQKAID